MWLKGGDISKLYMEEAGVIMFVGKKITQNRFDIISLVSSLGFLPFYPKGKILLCL